MKESDNKIGPLVSVIVPIYNVAGFIDRGLENLFRQDYTNFEILLINDGSTDESAVLCDAWAKKKESIRVFHKENGGAGSARNVGILNAQGEYIYFFDIDDYADSDLLSYNVQVMEEKQVDYILFGFRTITLSLNNRPDEIFFQEKLIKSNDELRSIYVDIFVLPKDGNGFPWNKFYRKSFLLEHQLFFENQRIQQDEVFNLKLYPYLEHAYISSRVLYTYYIYEKGNTRMRFIAERFDIYMSVRENFEILKEFWQLNDIRLDEYLNRRFYSSILSCILFNLFHKNCSWNRKEKLFELNRINENEYTREAVKYIKRHNLNMENRCYIMALCSCNLQMLESSYSLFVFLRRIKKLIR